MVEIAPVAVDAQGGKNAPSAMVQGAINATRKEISACRKGAVAVVCVELRRSPTRGLFLRLVHHLARYRGRLQFVPRSV